ncbi:MAG TPA: heparinase II/III family protein [Tepidisphaeraceae bacterium]|nr:heparinase II/III family protein [Tepidisphaeraceae bacterium]
MNRRFQSAPFCIVLLIATFTVRAADGPGPDPLQSLRKQHPRLIVLQPDLDRVHALLADKNPDVVKLHDSMRKAAEHMLKEKPVEYKLVGPRLLDKSRTARQRITLLAGLYRLDGDRAFADRAIKEMLAVCAFSDWHPPHFLDTAEMTAAVGLGYDWLYDVLTPEQRKIIRDAIRDKGLNAGLAAYGGKRPASWTHAHHNWAQVCGGGLSIGALSIADEEPAISSQILKDIYPTILGGMEALSPDGGCPEGPGYWSYATQYTVYCLAALDSALGTDWGLSKVPGFAQTGMFPIQTTGPTGWTFNFADAHEGPAGSAPQLFWLARKYNQPLFSAYERSLLHSGTDVFALFWFDPRGTFPSTELPPDAIFRHVDVACFRGSWTDPMTTFVGFKGGNNKANHAHLDLGSFVLDALGQRWATDLGPDDYNLPGYFGKQRWDYYRLKTEGHNTLVIDGKNQSTSARAPLIAFSPDPKHPLAVADLTAAYPSARKALRGIEQIESDRVVIEDEIESDKPIDVVWNFHTRAEIRIDKSTAVLTQGGATVDLKLLSPPAATFEIRSSNPLPPQKQQPDVHNLTIHLPGKVTGARIVVVMTPITGNLSRPDPVVMPLSEWIARGPLAPTESVPRPGAGGK